MGRPRKLETLTSTISGRIRTEQDHWLRWHADKRFEGELSRALRWALDQAEVFTAIIESNDPVEELDRMLHPEKYEPEYVHPEDRVLEAERELAQWQREQAIKRAQRRKKADAE